MTTPTNDEITQAFKEFDFDDDGYITEVEFRFAMNRRGDEITSDEIKSIFEHADDDGDGKINLDEFTEAWNS